MHGPYHHYCPILCTFVSSFMLLSPHPVSSNADAKRLYDDLLSGYNRLVRPVTDHRQPVVVALKLKLSQLIDVNLKDQIMTTNMWVEQRWHDYRLTWDPDEYGGVRQMLVLSEQIWRPDIVLYNNAAGDFELTLSTKAVVHFSGRIDWRPPANYKSSCEINVEYFPYDEQTCVMKFGSWTYDGFKVDLMHRDAVNHSQLFVADGIDLNDVTRSVEWDLLSVPAVKHVKRYLCCETPYVDITFSIVMRRKTLFYTVNLIVPCMGLSFLTVLVFYLPSESGEKISLSVSILVALTVFFLLLAEIIPATSLVVPLLGKYLLFTMILVALSICVTVLVLNVHFRSFASPPMQRWMRRTFLTYLPAKLGMQRPSRCRGMSFNPLTDKHLPVEFSLNAFQSIAHIEPKLLRAIRHVQFVALHNWQMYNKNQICEDWKYVAMVLDRLFLWTFFIAVASGTTIVAICVLYVRKN